MKCTVYVRPIPVVKEEAKPIGGLLDKRFKYTPAAATDIRKTFERIRNERLKVKAL